MERVGQLAVRGESGAKTEGTEKQLEYTQGKVTVFVTV
jgi:hypothetical protein